MSRKAAYEQKLKAQLDEWSAEIARMKAKADKADADAQLRFHDQISELQDKQQDVRKKLDELQNSGESAFDDLKAGIESAWHSMGKALEKAQSRF